MWKRGARGRKALILSDEEAVRWIDRQRLPTGGG
jgi:hypothetical protein